MKKNYMKVSVISVAAVLGVWIAGSALNCFNPIFIPSVKDGAGCQQIYSVRNGLCRDFYYGRNCTAD